MRKLSSILLAIFVALGTIGLGGWQITSSGVSHYMSGPFAILSQGGGCTTRIGSNSTTSVDIATCVINANILQINTYQESVGSVASASSVSLPNNSLTHITGTTAIATLSAANLWTAKATCYDLVADGAWSWTTAGNIATTGATAVANHLYRACYDTNTSKWYISG